MLISSQTLSAKNAAALDKDLMSVGAFSIDQLMELAGLSVSQAGLSFSSFAKVCLRLNFSSLSRSSSESRTAGFGCLRAGKQW